MARRKLSEFRAKQLLYKTLALPYRGVSLDTLSENFDTIEKLDLSKTYVVKVDEGIKKRMKTGLISLDKSPQELIVEIKKLQQKGYRHFIIEPFLPHDVQTEQYLSFERVRDGIHILYSEKGGIDIEENSDSIQKFVIKYSLREGFQIASEFPLEKKFMTELLTAFNLYHFSFLEINPLVVDQNQYTLLDVAVEVDSAGEYFVNQAWRGIDIRSGEIKQKNMAEQNVMELSYKSQASFALTALNPDGAIFMLLSGGGASIVLADEVYNLGFGKQLANYGEYSGNPNADEVYVYTKNILQLLFSSKAKKKVLLIAGGVANFTDVRVTFKGILKALEESVSQLQGEHIHVYVRRGGPHQEEGLAMMEAFLQKHKLLGAVRDQTTSLPQIVTMAVSDL